MFRFVSPHKPPWQGQGPSQSSLVKHPFFNRKFKLIYNDSKQTSISLGVEAEGIQRGQGASGGIAMPTVFIVVTVSQVSNPNLST